MAGPKRRRPVKEARTAVKPATRPRRGSNGDATPGPQKPTLAELLRLKERIGTRPLMDRSKKTLGLAEHGPAFIGTANLAQYWWCAEKSLLKSVEMEETFFDAYLLDRLSYAVELGRVGAPPCNADELLGVGADLKLSDIDGLLEKRAGSFGGDYRSEAESSTVDEVARRADEYLVKADRSPMSRGVAAEQLFAKTYPTIRWQLRVGDRILVGVPDGITDDFVYEFKSTRMGSVAWRLAETQADLYGKMFGRPEKVVEILQLPARTVESRRSPVDRGVLDRTFGRADAVYAGRSPAIPPQPWKCRPCEYRASCPVTSMRGP